MTTELDDLTWQSLYEYIERRITGAQNALQLIQKNTHGDDLAQSTARFKRELEWLGWCLPLVSEMLNKEDMQVICPIMSLDLIRLGCRHPHDGQDHSSDFAWISPIAEGKYFLKRIRVNNPGGLETLWSFEGDLSQIVEKLENLVKEICVQGNH